MSIDNGPAILAVEAYGSAPVGTAAVTPYSVAACFTAEALP